MEVDDLYNKLVESGVFQLPQALAESKQTDEKLLMELKRINGQCRDHKWNIRGLWAVVAAEAALFGRWLYSQFN